jgi:hypothetical protein
MLKKPSEEKHNPSGDRTLQRVRRIKTRFCDEENEA